MKQFYILLAFLVIVGAIGSALPTRKVEAQWKPGFPTFTPTPTSTSTETSTPTETATSGATSTPTSANTPAMELGGWDAGNTGTGPEATAVFIMHDEVGIEWERVRLICSDKNLTSCQAWWDPAIESKTDLGIKVLLEFWFTGDGSHSSGGDCSTGSYADYNTFVRNVVTTYGGSGSIDVHAIQPENEPDRCNDPWDTAIRVKIVADAIDDLGSSTLKHVLPGLAMDNFDTNDRPACWTGPDGPFYYSFINKFFTALRNLNGNDCTVPFDVIAMHDFDFAQCWSTVCAKKTHLLDLIATPAPGWQNKPVWLTEVGYPANPATPGAEATQAVRMLTMLESARDCEVKVSCIYRNLDEPDHYYGIMARATATGTPGTPVPVDKIAKPTIAAMSR